VLCEPILSLLWGLKDKTVKNNYSCNRLLRDNKLKIMKFDIKIPKGGKGGSEM
jgi:hypothetical protein